MSTSPETVQAALCAGIRQLLDDELQGLYLYGSLATGDFDEDVSDIDILAVLRHPLGASGLEGLREMHREIEHRFPDWQDRIEVAYVPLKALARFRERRSEIAVISPGEPLHFKEAGIDWLINWYAIQEQGIALLGPPFARLISPVSVGEYRASVRAQAREWREYVLEMDSRPAQGYAILTLCRALFASRYGKQASKAQAAEWARNELPAWSDLIERAQRWRIAHRERVEEASSTKDETVAFVRHVVQLVEAEATEARPELLDPPAGN